MQRKKLFVMPVIAGILIVIVSGIALAITQSVHAQCGSQASSCKNCHEVQAKKPVNNDGTPWHTSHAFGDFCYICHGGNQQATDETEAHTAMVDPLSDVKASCKSCHPTDYQAKAQLYATKLGVQLGSGSAPAAAGSSGATPVATATSSAAPASSGAAATPQPVAAQQSAGSPNSPDLVNYVQRYNENVLGQYPTNWGNVILLVMIGALLVGGGALVISHEGLVKVSFKDTKPVNDEFPADVVEMVPSLAKLKPSARKSLRRLLEKPDATAEVLTSIDKLSEGKSSGQKE
ncbi:MAG TPA: hypothetical protein VLX61_09880 [Anaerolineales bacterium]|nr:hypothetical protein [Anaerolineales bacterium]